MEANKHYVIHGSLSLDEAVTKEDHDALVGRVDDVEASETDIDERVTNLEKVKILTGLIENISIGANSTKDVTISFNFPKVPKVFTQLMTYPSASSVSWWNNLSVYIVNISATSCKLRIFNGNNTAASSGDFYIHWMAICDGD